MAISIDGLISGLDTAGIITKLVELEKRPVTLLEQKQETIDEELSAWQELNGKLLTFETAAQKLNTSSEYNAVSATFKNDNVNAGDIVKITTNSNVQESSYDITINRLATRQKMLGDLSYSSIQDPTHINTFTITMADGTSKVFTNNDTLDELKSSINASNMGVTASIINTSSSSTPSYRMVLSSTDVGSDNSFTVASVMDDSFGSPFTPFSFSTTSTAVDAEVVVDGITVTRSTNEFSDLIEGVTMELTGTGSGTLDIAGDTEAIIENIQGLVDAYNEVLDFMDTQFQYNSETDTTKPLFGNSTLRTIQRSLSDIMTGVVSGYSGSVSSTLTTLSQAGIKTDSSNRLSVDTALLTEAIRSNPTGVRNLFVPAASGTYTFVSASGATQAGAYDTQVVNQSGVLVMQMRLQGTSGSWISLTQDGNFYEGPAGSTLEGFALRATGLAEGETGTMTVTVGVAERIAYRVGFITEFSSEGAIYNERTHLETRKEKYQEQIDDLNLRITKKQETLKNKYAMLEVRLSQLKGQSDYLAQQLANLPGFSGIKSS